VVAIVEMAAMTDTLHVKVTDLRYPVNEEIVRTVFAPIAQPRNIHIVPNAPKGSAIAIVQFSDPRSAEACRQQRDSRCIYSECNRMEIAFTRWESFVPSGILGTPPAHIVGPYGMNPQTRGGFAPAYQVEGYDGRGRGRGRGRGTMPFGNGTPPPQAPMQPTYQPYTLTMPPGMPYQAPYANMMAFPQVQPSLPPMSVTVGSIPRGRGGIQLPVPMGMMPQMGMMMNPTMMNQMMRQPQVRVNVPNPFLSVAMLDKDVPLQPLFDLCEVYGQVAYIRRNFKKPEILTVKYQSAQEAQLAAMCIKHVPFFGSTISGRNFSSFEERAPEPTADGDPNDPSILGFNFANARHRPQETRGRFPPSEILRIEGFRTPITAESIHSFFESIGVPPVTVTADDNDSFTVTFTDVASGVKALCFGQGKVCGDENSCVTFKKSELKVQQQQQPQPQQNNNDDDSGVNTEAPVVEEPRED
jgi:hypothetical protein